MLKNDTLKNGTSRIGLYGSAPPPGMIALILFNYASKAAITFLLQGNVQMRYNPAIPIESDKYPASQESIKYSLFTYLTATSLFTVR